MPLRVLSFNYISPMADEDGNDRMPGWGDLMQLLRAADPYTFLPPEMPPLRILNSFLATGISDHGMSGGAEWEPFEVSEQEYQDLLAHLATQHGRERFPYEGEIILLDPPDWVKTVEDLSEWKIDEALKDPDHHLNGPEKKAMLPDGRMVTFREYWEWEKARRPRRSE